MYVKLLSPWLNLYDEATLLRIILSLLLSYAIADISYVRLPLRMKISLSEVFALSFIFLLPFDLRLSALLISVLFSIKFLKRVLLSRLLRRFLSDKILKLISRDEVEELSEMISLTYLLLIWKLYDYIGLGLLSNELVIGLMQLVTLTVLYVIYKSMEYYTEGLLRVFREGFKIKTILYPPFYHMVANTLIVPFLAFLSATFIKISVWVFLLFVFPIIPVIQSVFNYTRILVAAKDTIENLAQVVEGKCEELRGHSRKVAELSYELAKRMGLSFEEIEAVEQAAKLQNIGYVVIREDILQKPSELNEDEWREVRKHPSAGENILSNLKLFDRIRLIVRAHHERWDGRGYPDRLRGYEIPVEARIIAVADAFIAMTSKRPYRPPMSLTEALREIVDNRGTQFDPRVVDTLVEYLISTGRITREDYSKLIEEVRMARRLKRR